GHTPFYRIPYAIVPGTKYFRAPATVFFVGTMALAVLAAAGVERLLMRQMTVRYPFAWLGFALVVVVLGSLGILTDFAQALAPEQMVDAVIANSLEVVIGAWRSFAFILLAVAAMGFYLRGKIGIAAVGWALAFLMAADSWTIMRKYWVFSPPASVSFATDSAIDRILADREPSRVLALELEPNRFRDPNLQGDGLMAHRIRTVLGYHGNQLGRYNEILEKDRGFQQVINPKIWQIYNVRYLLTNTPDVEPLFPGSTRLLGPVKDAAGTPTYLFRLPGENPYGWVAPVIVKAEDEAVRMTMMNPAFDVDRAALFAADANVTAVTGLEMLPLATGIAAKVTQYAPGRVSLELDSPAPRGAALVVSENYFPGWTATVDGHPAAVGRADFTLVGVQLPEGGKKVELRFDDPAYETGKLITIVAIMLTLLLIAAGMFLERRARA
ncbi:MAG: YfhO family protein, partial [Gemmatimonadaceae bacterium]